MIVAKDPNIINKAKAYHDHGHDNNPNFPRWEDTRSSSGFNYRMMELQGAVGLAQLKKLPEVIRCQRINKAKIKEKLLEFKEIRFREIPFLSEETADALIFYTETPEIALKCREELLKEKLGTKILPEAISWHFAGTWNHMKELVDRYPNLSTAFPVSLKKLNHSVALPIVVNMDLSIPEKVASALKRVLR
jgi:8-amino-3,8-dideoxy-alpha-D-manno-octulosonate transaminase